MYDAEGRSRSRQLKQNPLLLLIFAAAPATGKLLPVQHYHNLNRQRPTVTSPSDKVKAGVLIRSEEVKEIVTSRGEGYQPPEEIPGEDIPL